MGNLSSYEFEQCCKQFVSKFFGSLLFTMTMMLTMVYITTSFPIQIADNKLLTNLTTKMSPQYQWYLQYNNGHRRNAIHVFECCIYIAFILHSILHIQQEMKSYSSSCSYLAEMVSNT